MSRVPNWFRWILFFPVSLLSLVVVYPLTKFLSIVFSVGGYGFFDQLWSILIGSGFTGFCFVLLGSLVVPKHHMIVAISLTALYGVLSGLMITTKMILEAESSSSWFEVVSFVIIGVIGAIVACYRIYEMKGFGDVEQSNSYLEH